MIGLLCNQVGQSKISTSDQVSGQVFMACMIDVIITFKAMNTIGILWLL